MIGEEEMEGPEGCPGRGSCCARPKRVWQTRDSNRTPESPYGLPLLSIAVAAVESSHP